MSGDSSKSNTLGGVGRAPSLKRKQKTLPPPCKDPRTNQRAHGVVWELAGLTALGGGAFTGIWETPRQSLDILQPARAMTSPQHRDRNLFQLTSSSPWTLTPPQDQSPCAIRTENGTHLTYRSSWNPGEGSATFPPQFEGTSTIGEFHHHQLLQTASSRPDEGGRGLFCSEAQQHLLYRTHFGGRK